MCRPPWLIGAAAIIMLFAAGCTAVVAPPPNRSAGTEPATVRVNLDAQPTTLDPNLVQDVYSAEVVEQMFLGLTNINGETGEVEPELATHWETSEDGLTWTFHLRDDVKWSDGKPVTAQDIEYSVRRAIMPETASPYAYALYIIKNALAINQTALPTDTYSIESLGVKALDDVTVQFDLEAPASYFPSIVGLWTVRALPSWAIEGFGQAWTEPQNIVVNGPYKLAEWNLDNNLVLAKNPDYVQAAEVPIERFDVTFITDQNTVVALYEQGGLDITGGQPLPVEILSRLRADPELSAQLHEGPRAETNYVGFTMTKPPFDSALVRKAFSAAIDREALLATITGSGTVATQFAPKGIFGAPEPEIGIGYDLEQGRQWLAEAGYPEGQGFPEVTLRYASLTTLKATAEALQSMWKEGLGIEVRLEQQEFPVFLASTAPSVPPDEMPEMWLLGWLADYPDENNFVYQVLHCTDSENRSRAACTEADKLAAQAGQETDLEQRKELYKQVEQAMIADEVRIAPFTHDGYTVLTKPFIERGYPTFGPAQWDRWKINR
jgi:oligopeptide transport system substrate-binding protein